MTPQEARNLMPGDTIDYVIGPDWDDGRVIEVKKFRSGTTVVVRSNGGYGIEVIAASAIISRTASVLRKPTPSLKTCRDMTRGYIP